MFLSMAEYFFSLTDDEASLDKKRHIFKECLIGQDEDNPNFVEDLCGQYPTIFLSFKVNANIR